MPFIEWSDALDVGVTKMNDEHKELIRLMNRVKDLNDAAQSKNVIFQALVDLDRATRRHFADEERYMEQIGFTGISSHKLIHADLLGKLDEFAASFKGGIAQQLDESFFRFLNLWLTAHIRGVDKRYASVATV